MFYILIIILISILILFCIHKYISYNKLYKDYKDKKDYFDDTLNNVKTIKFSNEYYLTKGERYAFQNFESFKFHFLDMRYKYKIVNKNEYADIFIIDIYNTINNDDLLKCKYSILVGVENTKYWKHYKFYDEDNKDENFWKNYDGTSKKFKITKYFNNDITHPTYNQIPTVYAYIRNFIINKGTINFKITDFNNKKDILMINKSTLNPLISTFVSKLSSKYNVDNISMYNDIIANKSCYNSIELLEVFNKYKFILCVENSYSPGYITEKIFNCFFAKTIPIYSGHISINDYIYSDSYIDINSEYMTQLENIYNNEEEYNNIINKNKIKNIIDLEKYFEINIGDTPMTPV
jgi:hypothetical protein